MSDQSGNTLFPELPGDDLTDKGKRRRSSRFADRMLRIRVEQGDIEGAVRADSRHCMIADAIKRQVPGADKVSVDLQTVRFSDPKKRVRYIYLTPPPAQLNLVKFDQGVQSEPFEFRLRGCTVVQTENARREEGTLKRRAVNAGVRSDGTPDYDKVHIVGGKIPPRLRDTGNPRKSHASGGTARRFGMKGFTWDEGAPEKGVDPTE